MKTMNFQILVLAFAVVIATNIHCQAQPELGSSDKSAEVKDPVMPRKCNCKGRGTALDQNCLCEPWKNRLSKVEKNLCKKKGILTFKKCQQFIGAYKKSAKGFSMPI